MFAYSKEELDALDRTARIRSGKEHSDVLSLSLTGYQVAPGVVFLNSSMPSLTVTAKNLKFNKVCHDRLNNCRYIDILYHPILQMLIIRKSMGKTSNSVEWRTINEKNIASIGSKAFSRALYEGLDWNKEYNFKFRGITKKRGGTTFIMFHLDEPQILTSKRVMDDITASNRYIAHQNENGNPHTEDWTDGCVRFSYELHQKRSEIINAITETDILEIGEPVANPMIGDIPNRNEVTEELARILECM